MKKSTRNHLAWKALLLQTETKEIVFKNVRKRDIRALARGLNVSEKKARKFLKTLLQKIIKETF